MVLEETQVALIYIRKLYLPDAPDITFLRLPVYPVGLAPVFLFIWGVDIDDMG